MATVTHDNATPGNTLPPSRMASGISLAVAAAMSFSLSGPLAKGLITAGWTPGAAVTTRVLIAAGVLLVPGLIALRGRWSLLRQNAKLLIAYGAIAVAGCQLAYFNAVDRMQVGIALLIEFTCPVAVLIWMWLRHGQRPSRITVIGAATALAGLVLVLDLVSGGADLDGLGVVWAITSMLCAAVYWIVSADESNGLPGIVLASGGLLTGGIILLAAGLVGIIPLAASTGDVVLAETAFPWWLALLLLGTVTAGLAYVLGIAATRRLGSRLASFVGLSEVVCGVFFAWLLLGEQPRTVQLAGGALILLGVIAVRLGEPRVVAEAVTPTAP
ncbi:EamA family transporter [Aeromicrobium sp. P5_D10]